MKLFASNHNIKVWHLTVSVFALGLILRLALGAVPVPDEKPGATTYLPSHHWGHHRYVMYQREYEYDMVPRQTMELEPQPYAEPALYMHPNY